MPNNKYHEEGIAIIGLACYYPKSHGIDQFWNNIINKVYCITDIPKGRWDPALYYDPDKDAPDKTYSKIGGFVDDVDFNTLTLKYKIPPKVINAMDRSQKFALLTTGDALNDAGYMNKDFDRSRTAVILGNSMGGDMIDYTNLRIFMSDIANDLKNGSVFSGIEPKKQELIINELMYKVKNSIPNVTEDTMPGELANVIAGRISNALNLTGPSFTVDAACASSLASLKEASRGLKYGDFDMAIAGGTDFLMGPGPYIKFCKIKTLSPDGSRPFDAAANGFVMGEGTGIFILKRVSDARRDGDKIFAIITGVGSSADGKGKGITAPNPAGQSIAISRAFEDAGYSPETVQYVEAHGTSTVVGDLAEMEGLLSVWSNKNVKNGSVGIGSIKSNIGHLKAAAGSASIVKLALALDKKIIPPSINFKIPNPNIEFGKIPFRVIINAEEWPEGINGNPRRGNASAFGFGGTNFHVTLEEDTGENGMPVKTNYFTGTEFHKGDMQVMSEAKDTNKGSVLFDYSHKRYQLSEENYKKLEGEAVVIGGSSWQDINEKLINLKQTIDPNSVNSLRDLMKRFNIQSNSMDYRLGISALSVEDFLNKFDTASEGFENIKKRMVLKNKGLFYGEDLLEKKKSLAKVCVMFPGQGAQYANMLKDLYNKYNVVRDTYHEADEIMYKIIGRSISEIIFLSDDASKEEISNTESQLRQTEITQPGVLTANYAMFRLLKSFGIVPDVVVGHSLGEYGALIAAGVMSFRDALYAVSARGREIAKVKWDDVGKMASVPATVEKAEQIIKDIPGYVIIANKNCHSQTVVAGDSPSIEEVLRRCEAEGIPAQEIPVSHAFHSKIVAPACESYRKIIESFDIKSPEIDIVANLTGDYYPRGENVKERIVDILVQHIASPVEFIKQVERMYADGVNIFVEAGPKRTLTSFVLNILDKRPHLAMATNHPKRGGIGTLNDALAAMSTQGFDIDWNGIDETGKKMSDPDWRLRSDFLGKPEIIITKSQVSDEKNSISNIPIKDYSGVSVDDIFTDYQTKQKELIQDVINLYSKKSEELLKAQLRDALYYKTQVERHNIHFDRIMISGVSLGLPGERFKVFDDSGFDRLAQGINMIDPVPVNIRENMAEKNITRLLKKSDGEASFVTITDKDEVVKLVGRKGEFDFQKDYGFDQEYADKLEITTQLAIAAGIEALKDAGIPLVMNYKRTSTNKLLPAYWALPEDLQHDTGIIFAAAFPGENSVIEELNRALAYKYGSKSKKELITLYTSLIEKIKDEKIREELSDWYAENYLLLKDGVEEDIYKFNNKFIFKILVMGHSQFAELIKAKGPNIHINAACSSTTAGIGIAEDWIRTGRAKRVVIIASDDVTSDVFIEWILSGFLAVGAVTTQGKIEDAAIPFDKRRNGFIVGMGATGIVVEAESEINKRGMEPIVEVVSTEFLNSAFHGTRIDNDHVSMVMEKAISKAENRLNIKREEIAKDMLFMSHETYTPARGGSASSEVKALRETFKENYKDVLVSNTKGFTGHAMAVGVEDVVAVKCLQTGKVPPIANFREMDPELGMINLSKGGTHEHIKYALRLGAGFGSQIAVSVLKLVSRRENRVIEDSVYKNWLAKLSGIDNPELEIVNRTLRVKDDGSILKKDREKSVKIPTEEPRQEQAVQQPQSVEVPRQIQEADSKEGAESNTIQKKILEIVGEKTGYPEDLIEFDLDMESDLGIDTVKQAEMFGMIRETFQIPADENIVIKDFPTLNHVVEFVKKRSPLKFSDISEASAPAKPAAASVATPAVEAQQAGGGLNEIQRKIIAIVGEKTGYPEDLIEFDLDMESDLGIDTVKQAEMFGMIRETFQIPADESIVIKDFPTLNHVVEFVRDRSPLKFSDVTSVATTSVAASAVSAPAQSVSVQSVVEPSESAPSQPSGGLDEIQKKIIAIVEEKTGYPEDLIEFDLDMESDLGIDTVKQAEMFGMIRETFQIPADESIVIKDFPTLNHVVEFVRDRSPLKFDSPSVPTYPEPASAQPPVQPLPSESAQPELDEIQKKIIKIVEEKTGYPEELIEFDLDMESDLGIDTVKQAEMFGMIRETFQIPADESIVIKDFPTLNHVVNFVKTKSPKFSSDTATVAAPAKEKQITEKSPDVTKSNIKRMTLEMVDEELEKNAKNKFNVKGYNILITDDGRGVAKALQKILAELEANVEILDSSRMETTESLTEEIERIKKSGKVNGIIHLTSIEESAALDDMNFEDWKANVFKRVKSLFFIAKSLQSDITANGEKGNAFIASVTDMGGTFGIESFKANNPIGGGVTGLTKALNKEFNDNINGVRVKSIDIEYKGKPATIAKTIWNEIQLGGDRVEVGYSGQDRKVPQVIYNDLDFDAEPRNIFGQDDVFVVTGGGYGITSAIAKDIAKNLKARLAIISLESLPSNIEELAALDEQGLNELKDKVISELKSQNERVTPVMIDKEYSKYTIAIDIYKNIEEMKNLGSPDVQYYSCNVMDHKAMTVTINSIREKFGRIDAIIHGAGINKDKFIADKPFEDFSRIVDVKADGCYNLMESTKKDGVKVLVTFASIAGRFGNIGQTDYSAANDLLNKYAQHSNTRFAPNMKAVSMNWSGWKGVGMATRGSITKIFEEANIDMIPMKEGISKVREDLLYGEDAEVLIAGNVGYIDIDKLIVGYKTKDFMKREILINSFKDKYPMVDSIESYIPGKKIVVRKKLDTETDLYLKDHAVDEIPYLPAVMGIESFAEASSLLFLNKHIKLMKDISFAIPVKILKGKPVNLIITAEKINTNGDEITLKTKLESEFFNKDGVKLGDNKIHFEATVVLSDSIPKDKLKGDMLDMDILGRFKENKKTVIDKSEIYRRFFHGPMYQVHGGVIDLNDNTVYGIAIPKNGKGESHFSFVKKTSFMSDPLAIEAAFQNAGLFTMAKKDKMSLPDGIKELVFKPIPSSAKELYVSAEYLGSDDMRHEYNTVVMDGEGRVYSVMKGYKMITTGDLSEDEKF